MTCQNPMYHFWAKSLSKLCCLITKRWPYNFTLFGSSLLLLICMIHLYRKAFINLSFWLGNIPLSQNIFIHSFSIKYILPNHNMFTFYLSFYVFDSPHEAFINLRMYRDLQTIFNFHCVKLSVNIDEIIYLNIETQSWLLVQCLIANNSWVRQVLL